MEKILITSALPYANGYIHLGHIAGAYLPADIFARMQRLRGANVLYVCGSDEYGVAITIAAEKEKVTPQDIIDKYHFANKDAFSRFGISFDIYSRTSTPEHSETAREFFSDFLKKGYLIEREEDQYYDPKANMFLPDRYVEGECPNCGSEGARGDQCDKCGAYYNQTELKNPKSLVSGETPIVKKTTHWYFRFGEFQPFLEKYINNHSKDWKDNVIQQSKSWLKQGLSDRAVTRDLSWGVSLEGIEGIPPEKAKGKAIYVWFEAVLGYISITKRYCEELKEKGKKCDWKEWWQDLSTKYYAFIGKDNIVFHTLLFPAMLHAKDGHYILPENVPANEFLNLEGQKFSKSRNWSIDLKDLMNEFQDNRLIDTLRYTLAMNFPENKDSDFTWKDFQARNNNELAAIYGNFINRTFQFIHKYFDGEVPNIIEEKHNVKSLWKTALESVAINDYTEEEFRTKHAGKLNPNEVELLIAMIWGKRKIEDHYSKFRFRDAITETMNIARAANKFFNDEEPWKTIKIDKDKCAYTLYLCVQLAHKLAVLFYPILPFTSEKIYEMLNDGGKNMLDHSSFFTWGGLEYNLVPESIKIKQPEILFGKIEDDFVEIQTAKLGTTNQAEEMDEKSNLITYDDFMNVKLLTAKIIAAEKIKKSKKLLKLQVDTGGSTRQIVAGIAEHYEPESLLGKTVVVVSNLQPAKLMGEESNGMLLAANAPGGKLSLVMPDNEVEPGSEVR